MENINIPRNINLQKDNTLLLNLYGLKERQYGVSVKYYRNNENIPYKRVDYNSTVFINKHSNGWLIDINKENVYFNQHEPDLVSETISSLISKALYPVQTLVDISGNSLKGITNHYQILNRWEKNKSTIKNKYSGSATESLITAVDKKISNKVRFEQAMDYDIFWNLFFHPKYFSYTQKLSIETYLSIAVVPYQTPIEFSGRQRLHSEITNYNSIRLDFISDEIEAHSYFVPIENNPELKYLMRLKVYFDLDFHNFFPMHTRAYFEVFSKDDDGVESIFKKIQFTQYQTNTVDNIKHASKPKSMFEVTGNESKSQFKPPKKKKTFMDYIYDFLGG